MATTTGIQADDRTLMQRARGGEQEAFAELFHRNADRIRRVAYLMLHDDSAADDAVQETFTRALERIGDYRGEAEPATWFTSIGLNHCRQALRRLREHAVNAPHEALDRGRRLSPAARGVFTSVVRREHKQKLAIGLGYLTEAQREVFVLHYVEGIPYEEICTILDIGLNAALSLGYRARGVLASKMPCLVRDLVNDE